MFSLGILGVLQVLFFPGLIIKKFFKLPTNFFVILASIIGFSLISNFLIVFLLTSIGIFYQWLLFLIIIIELFVIIFLYQNELLNLNFGSVLSNTWKSISSSICSLFPEIGEHENIIIKVIRYVIMIFSLVIGLIAIEWIFRFFRYNLGEVFNTWDAVVSWNRWAVDWASNRMPLRTQDYPQLIPANWAMIYKILGSTKIQFFATAIMPLFPFLILLLLFGLGIETKNPAFFLSIEVTRLFMKKFSAEFIAAGYVDFTLTFFVLLAMIYLFFAFREKNLERKTHYILLSFIFVSGSIITKQPGFYVLACFSLLTIFFFFRKDFKTYFNQYKKQLVLMIVFVAIIIGPWYLYKGIQILSGLEETHLLGALEHTNQVHNNESLFANFIPGLKSLGNYLYLILLIIPGLFFIDKFWRIISIIVVFPYIGLWAAYASYDPRNLTMMYPIISVLFSLGIVGFFFWFSGILVKFKIDRIPFYVFLLLGFLATILTGQFWLKNDKLEYLQIEKQKQIFSSELNNKLYDYFANNNIDGKILTNYPVNFLPGFENTQKTIVFDELSQLTTGIKESDTEYLLYPTNLSGDIQLYLDDLVGRGELEIIFTTETWIPYTFAILQR